MDRTLSRRGVAVIGAVALLVSLLQSPGRLAADTKLDLTANPLGFLGRAMHLWTPTAPMGQVQNQAYGYFFPHGAFFAVGELAHIPPWITQRLWWAVLLTVGVVGVVRLGEALRIGSPGSRLIAAVVFVLSPRVLTTLGSISSETLPMMLAPWVLIPLVRALDVRPARGAPLWRDAARSAVAVALMGAVNAVATLAAVGVALLWWVLCGVTTGDRRRWITFGGLWASALVLACAWWVAPLLILSRVSPPFLDFIESSRVTTEWTSLTEVLRGTSAWTPFVSPERVAGAVLVTEPAAVLATGTLAATGLAGLCMRRMPFRGRAITILVVGLLLMCTGYVGGLGSPVAEQVRQFLDGSGAFLRNIHKFEPFVRLPLVLGTAHLLARVPLPGTASVRDTLSAFAHPQRSRPVAATMIVLVAIVGAGSLMWTGQLAPAGSYRALPDYWRQTADWLGEHAADDNPDHPTRTLVVPGSPFADQLWGLTRDEPLQPLASTPWAVRDAIPLTPPGAIRAMDSVQRDIAGGRGSPGLAATLAQQGVGYVVLRADLDPQTSRSARPLLAQQALNSSPGLRRVATFGPDVGPPTVPGVVRDNGLRPQMPAIQIYAVTPPNGGGTEVGAGVEFPGTGPLLVDTASATRIVGGPESIAAVQDLRARLWLAPLGPTVLEADARRAGLPDAPVLVTDTPADRETDFGRVDDHSSAIRSPGDPRRTQNAAPDYPVDGQPLTEGQWLLDNRPGEVSVSASGSAADATQPGQTSPANSTAAAFDGDAASAWVSNGLSSAVGQWLRLDFTRPRSDLALRLTTARALGPDVTSILVTTEAGSTVVSGVEPGKPVTVTAPSGPTRWVQIRAIRTENGTAGNQFALGEVEVTDLNTGAALPIRHRVILPALPADTRVSGWVLSQELSGRSSCVEADDLVRCAAGLGLSPENPAVLSRALSVPQETTVAPVMILRPHPGDGLTELLTTPGSVTAEGAATVNDPRGSAAAAVDGDPRTVWTAADDTDEQRERGAKKHHPTLRVTLPTPQRVETIQLVVPEDYPAAPTKVAVDLGTGAQERSVGRDGLITVNPATTDHISITVLDRRDLIDVNSLGFTSVAPTGIAEVRVQPAPAGGDDRPADDRPVDIGCAAGIGITVSGQVIPMRVTTTAGALRAGDPVVARPCLPSVRLPAGEQELSANPGPAFTVDTVGLDAGGDFGAAAPAAARAPTVDAWSPTRRSLDIDTAAAQRLLVVPESTNPGWQARLGGQTLRPVVINGWEQGWVIPAGASGHVDLTFRYDSLYRWSLAIGFALLATLFVIAVLPLRRHRDSPPEPGVADRPLPLAAAGMATAGWLAASWVLTGWWGVAATAVVGVAVGVAALRRRSAPVVAAAFVAMMAATIGLAAGPWQAPGGYHGFSWWVQLPALLAVAVTVWSVLAPLLVERARIRVERARIRVERARPPT
ncbi:alpha-(1-_3)-arabinofuranosyltransferase domain-containing protein [Gordonia sp. NPDC003429]